MVDINSCRFSYKILVLTGYVRIYIYIYIYINKLNTHIIDLVKKKYRFSKKRMKRASKIIISVNGTKIMAYVNNGINCENFASALVYFIYK